MGESNSKGVRLAKVDTGVLVHSHSSGGENNHKAGAGGAALAGDGKILYVLGNKGLAVFDCSDPARLIKIRQIDTGAIT